MEREVRSHNWFMERYPDKFILVEIVESDHSRDAQTGILVGLYDDMVEAFRVQCASDIEMVVLPGSHHHPMGVIM